MPLTKSGEAIELIPEGARIRHRKHPELTGHIKAHEWNDRENRIISPIPYCIGWDDSALAYDLLGMFFVYAGNEGIESVEVPA